MAERLVIYQSGRNYRIRVETDNEGVLLRSEPYRSPNAAEAAAWALKRLWPEAEVVLPGQVVSSPEVALSRPDRSQLSLPEEAIVRVRLTGIEGAPLDYADGLGLSDLRSILADCAQIYDAASQIVLATWSPSTATVPADEMPDARVKIRSGSVVLEFLAETSPTALAVISVFGAILKGPPAIAALPGKTRAAWHNAQADAAEALTRAEEARRRLAEERGLGRVTTKGIPELDSVRHLEVVQQLDAPKE